jgi:hypothetical protein
LYELATPYPAVRTKNDQRASKAECDAQAELEGPMLDSHSLADLKVQIRNSRVFAEQLQNGPLKGLNNSPRANRTVRNLHTLRTVSRAANQSKARRADGMCTPAQCHERWPNARATSEQRQRTRTRTPAARCASCPLRPAPRPAPSRVLRSHPPTRRGWGKSRTFPRARGSRTQLPSNCPGPEFFLSWNFPGWFSGRGGYRAEVIAMRRCGR